MGLVILIATGCQGKPTPKLTEVTALDVEPALISVTPARTDLLFRYRDEDAYRTATSVEEIPQASRGQVQVIDLSKTPAARGNAQWVQLFNLSSEGAYRGRLVRRADLERAMKSAHEAKPKAARIVMYSTAWCGVCKKAAKFMTKNGIAFVEKDIEKDKGARREMQKKATAAGVRTGGVPVFDLGGTIQPGFDPATILRAAGKTSGPG